jgi:L-rhamnose isomerase
VTFPDGHTSWLEHQIRLLLALRRVDLNDEYDIHKKTNNRDGLQNVHLKRLRLDEFALAVGIDRDPAAMSHPTFQTDRVIVELFKQFLKE